MIPTVLSVCSGTLAALFSFCPTMAPNYITEAIVGIMFSLFGIIAGLVTKNKIAPLISAQDYKAAEKPLLIWAIMGCLCYGGGTLLLIQYILIKIGKN
ncbi:MAG TPA: hypothetical protein VKK79_02000 [Candidatus Lokiarchaeia archaeon]|nr:hypothetical protein [Candidatus Lokiarchaeia archaeon]